MNTNDMRQQRAAILAQAKGLMAGAQTDKRGLSNDERTQFDALMGQADTMKADIERADKVESETRDLGEINTPANKPVMNVPNINKLPLGDNEVRAAAHYIRTGDARALGGEVRSNATDMNIGTNADGGYAVPTGHYQGIIAKRDSMMLANKLGVQKIPGIGTTVNVPVDDGTANAFVLTTEATGFDVDAPALNQAAMTLLMYTKKITLSYQLLQDEDSKLMAFIDNYIGRAMALTHNALLLTAALAGGTTKALAAVAAASAADVNGIMYSLKGEYLDNAAWVMARATEAAYHNIASSSVYTFADTPNGNLNPSIVSSLGGYPVYNSASMPAIGSGNKSVVFGNWNFVGMREEPGLTMLRDPYSAAGTGQIVMHYYFRTVYKVLIAEAIYYGTHPTA